MNTPNQLPQAFLAKLPFIFSPDQISSIVDAFASKPVLSFRVNTLKISEDECQKELTKLDFDSEKVIEIPHAYILKNKTTKELTDTTLYQDGYIYIQNLSSMIPALILNPKPDEYILDLTAAPGSKTTQIADLMVNSGQIVANDISRARNFKLLNNLKVYGVTNTKVLTSAAQTLWQKFPEQFDKTLVDAPCSMEGRFRTDDPKSYQDWSAKKVKVLGKKNQYILRSAISATKVGGTIVYSTCTLSPEENELVIDWIVKTEKDAIKIETIEKTGIPITPALTIWNNKKLDPDIKNCGRIIPTQNYEGFFIAKIKKLKSTIPLENLKL